MCIRDSKCLQWLRDDYASLESEARDKVDVMLEGTGCEILFDSDTLNEEN